MAEFTPRCWRKARWKTAFPAWRKARPIHGILRNARFLSYRSGDRKHALYFDPVGNGVERKRQRHSDRYRAHWRRSDRNSADGGSQQRGTPLFCAGAVGRNCPLACEPYRRRVAAVRQGNFRMSAVKNTIRKNARFFCKCRSMHFAQKIWRFSYALVLN